MCQYSNLSKNNEGNVKWCRDCEAYHLSFNNLIMSFTAPSFNKFKENLNDCYEVHLDKGFCRNQRQIVFNTRLDGMQLLFSVNEVGSLLALMQEAELELMLINEKQI